MKQLKVTLSLFALSSLSLSSMAHANALVNAGGDFMQIARKALTEGFAHTPTCSKQDLYVFVKAFHRETRTHMQPG